MTGPKLNEAPVIRRRPESRAQAVSAELPSAKAIARHVRVSPYKVRQVLDLIRGHETQRALDILRLCERDAAIVVGKILASAMANAEHNHALSTDDLFVSACFADEGPTLKRWRPRARGRATRIRKRTCHVTVIVSRLPESELRQRRAQRAQATSGRRGGPRRPQAATPGRPERTGRGRRRDESTASATTITSAAGGVDTSSFDKKPVPDQPVSQQPVSQKPVSPQPVSDVTESVATTGPTAQPEVSTTMADETAPTADPITASPEVRTEGPAAGGDGTTDAPEDDTTSAGSEGDSSAAGSDKE